MNIGIIGTGGVGGYFGGKIAEYCKRNDEDKVYFIARGEHLKKINEDGLEVKTSEGTFICSPYMATDSFYDLPLLDICFIAVKGYDLEDILLKIKNKVNENTEIIPLLNGIDICDRIRKIITNAIVYPACVYIGTHIEKPGVIIQNGGSCTIKFGNEKNDFKSDGKRICTLLKNSKIKFEYSSKNYSEIWNKYMFIASYGLVTAYYDKTLGQVYENSDLSKKVIEIMRLIEILAGKKNIELPENIIELSYNKAKSFPYETKTSFQRDYEKETGKDERDVFGKAIIDMAESLNIDCECVKNIYDKLR